MTLSSIFFWIILLNQVQISAHITSLLQNAFFLWINLYLYIFYSLEVYTKEKLLTSDVVRSLRNVIHRKYSTFNIKRKIFMYVVKSYDQHFFHCRFLISLDNMSCFVKKNISWELKHASTFLRAARISRKEFLASSVNSLYNNCVAICCIISQLNCVCLHFVPRPKIILCSNYTLLWGLDFVNCLNEWIR